MLSGQELRQALAVIYNPSSSPSERAAAQATCDNFSNNNNEDM